MPEHEELVLAVGPYLLGALDPETRRQLRDHLDVCQLCRDELVRLAAVPGFLAQASPRLIEPEAEPSPGLRARLVQQVIAERDAKRRRAQQLAVAAVTLLVLLPAGVVTGLRIGSGAATPGPSSTATEAAASAPTYQQMATTPSSGSLRGEISWVAHTWGVELNLATWGARPEERLRLFAESVDGSRDEQTAVWQTVADRRIPCTGQSSILEQDMRRVYVLNDADQEVLVLEIQQRDVQ